MVTKGRNGVAKSTMREGHRTLDKQTMQFSSYNDNEILHHSGGVHWMMYTTIPTSLKLDLELKICQKFGGFRVLEKSENREITFKLKDFSGTPKNSIG